MVEKVWYEIIPEYFLFDEPLIVKTAKELEHFLNYSRYPCKIKTIDEEEQETEDLILDALEEIERLEEVNEGILIRHGYGVRPHWVSADLSLNENRIKQLRTFVNESRKDLKDVH